MGVDCPRSIAQPKEELGSNDRRSHPARGPGKAPAGALRALVPSLRGPPTPARGPTGVLGPSTPRASPGGRGPGGRITGPPVGSRTSSLLPERGRALLVGAFLLPKQQQGVIPIGKRIAVAAVLVAAAIGMAGPAQAAADKDKPINEKRIWKQRWDKARGWEQDWAVSTGSCESGNSAHINTGNGFLGAFQYVPSTWWAAPATGGKRGEAHHLPHLEPWKVQAVVSIKLMRRDGTGHWPNCG